MAHFKSPTSLGVAETFVALGAIYFVFMMFGVFTVRLPAPGGCRRDGAPPAAKRMITTARRASQRSDAHAAVLAALDRCSA